jgi:CHAT domain-containing protein
VLARIENELKDLVARRETVSAEIRYANPAYAALTQVGPLSLSEIQQKIVDDRTLLLEYHLGEQRSYLWAVTPGSIQSFELPQRAAIEAAARRVYELLTTRNQRVKFETAEERRARVVHADASYTQAAEALSRMVLGPLQNQLGDKRLLIVSDGALQYVPFAALPAASGSGQTPLGLNHEIVSLPSASTLLVLRRDLAQRKPAAKTIAVLADPVFDDSDQRVRASLSRLRIQPSASAGRRSLNIQRSEIESSAGESGWESETLNTSRLPFTRKEATAITALVPAGERLEQLDFDASLASARSENLSHYRIVHFATHGFLNSRHPELSGIMLSLVDEQGREQNGFLRAHEIYDLKLPAELVVLSGCRTGLGREVRGEGLIGLTRAFMHAGAARVMVSLWDVHDEATAELMARFYSRLLGPEKLSPAAALRAAQRSMSEDKRWASPYFWAGFTLQGEPR